MLQGFIIIILFIFVSFLISYNKNKKEIQESGEIRQNFSELIDLIIKNDLNLKISDYNNNRIILTGGGPTTQVRYVLTYAFQTITVNYSISSYMTGKHSFELVMRENISQEAMYDKIVDEINILGIKMGIV